MGKYKPNRYSADNGKYERYRNEEGKAEGIIKVEAEVGRNALCPCKSGLKYKNCCLKKGRFYVKAKKTPFRNRLGSMKVRLSRLFKR
jgi:uncharacterized protein YchJ